MTSMELAKNNTKLLLDTITDCMFQACNNDKLMVNIKCCKFEVQIDGNKTIVKIKTFSFFFRLDISEVIVYKLNTSTVNGQETTGNVIYCNTKKIRDIKNYEKTAQKDFKNLLDKVLILDFVPDINRANGISTKDLLVPMSYRED